MISLSNKFTVRKRIQVVSPLKRYKLIINGDINRPRILRWWGCQYILTKESFCYRPNILYMRYAPIPIAVPKVQ